MGTRERRQREANQRRAGILRAARGLFTRQGFGGTTMPQVAAAAELAAGTLYLYFPSKSALYAELALEAYGRLEGRLRAAAGGRGSARTRGRRLAEAFVGFATEAPSDYDMIFFVLQREAGGWEGSLEPEQLGRLRACEQRCRDLLVGVVRSARPRATAEQLTVLANTIWSMLAGVIFYFKTRPEFPAIAEEATGLMLAALFGGGRPRA